MRNLALYDVTRYTAGDLSHTTDALVANDTLYLVIDDLVYQSDLNGVICSCVSIEHKCLTRISFMIFEQKLWFGTGKSFIYYCPVLKVVEVIDSPEQFCAAVWSPSQETLVVVSVDAQVLVYSIDNVLRQLKCLGSCHLSDLITITSTNVGWGSVNTQFRGSEGKLSALKKIEEKVKEVQDKIPRILWCSDQEYFLINYWSSGKRVFKVFQLPCIPVYVCEDIPGLQAPISWRCTGNMIACPAYTDKFRITIFEKNGLKKHSFDLHDQIEVIDLEWNSTGEILAVHQKSDKESYLSLYKISNYHWYLKQRLDFTKENPLTSFKWTDRSDSIFELTVSTTKEILVYQFICKVFRSVKSDSHGTCAVIDGNKVLMYYFAYAVMAPPDANEIIELKNPVSHILFNSAEHEILLIDCKYRCYLFSYEDKHFVNKEENNLEIPTEFKQYPYSMHHFCWRTDGNLYGIGMCADKDRIDVLFKYNCNFKLLDKKTVQPKVNHIEFLNYSNSFLILSAGGEIFLSDTILTKRFSASSILHLEVHICAGKLLLFSLNLANQFYIDDICVAEHVTSFLSNSGYLYVTTQDILYCLRLTAKEIEYAKSSGLADHGYSRRMESGGVLILGIPNNIGVVLQMPRGNLEVDTCRIAAIDKLNALLDQGLWTESFELIRTERLNTNLLVDLNPHRFFEQIPEILTQADSSNFLINFLLELVDESVLTTIYKTCNLEIFHNVKDKKKVVCRSIISSISGFDMKSLIRVVVIAYINIDGISRAVEYLRGIHYANQEENARTVLNGLDCLKLYFSYEDICVSALSTYDTDFALFVYLQSSMDPKVYKPLIDEFNACENELLRRFKINDYLGLNSEAMVYLAKDVSHRYLRGESYNAIDLNPLVQYATKHTLLPELYNMCNTTGLFFTEVSLAYASYLCSRQLHKEAGIVFACAKFYEEALEQYKLCNRWKEAMIVLDKINLNETNKLVHISEIAKGLEGSDNYKDSSFLYEMYLKECELAVTALVKGNLFSEAVRVAQKFERIDLIDTIIEPRFQDFVGNMYKKMNSSQESFNKYKSRLRIVRQKKIEMFHATSEGGLHELDNIDNTGNQSSSASVSSRTTRSIRSRSSTSTRSRRKEELKKQDTREGGYYEDIALIKTLHQLITEVFALGPEIGDMCHLSFLLKTPNTAKNLQNLLENLQLAMTKSLPEIWPENLYSLRAATTPELLALRDNLDFLELSFRCPPEVPRKSWKLNFK